MAVPPLTIVKKVRRRKATEPRSRKGCRTCRIRHVKCDETHPSCKKCTNTGRWCEWFSNSFDKESPPRSTSPLASTEAIRYIDLKQNQLYPLSETPYASAEQVRSFNYFRRRTIPQLSNAYASELWDFALLQATHHSETVRYAVIALGSLHERFENCDPTILKSNKDFIQGGFALQQYVKAIGTLIKPSPTLPRTQIDVYLVACLLFTFFETLRGHQGSALQHVKCGVHILYEIAGDAKDSPYRTAITNIDRPVVPLELLAIIFTRLDTQARQFQESPLWEFAMAQRWKACSKGFCDEIPEAFTSLTEAQNSLDYTWNDIVHILEGVLPHDNSKLEHSSHPNAYFERQRLLARGKQWADAFKKYNANLKTELSTQEMRASHFMNLFALLGTVSLKTSGPHDEMIYDQFIQEYAQSLQLCEAIVSDSTDSNGPTTDQPAYKVKQSPRFQPEMGVVVALFEVLWKCRNPVIRRRAITLLEDNPIQEGLWDGTLVAKLGRRIVELEEGDRGQNLENGLVVKRTRISNVDLHFDMEERVGQVSYTQGYAGLCETPVTFFEVINW